MIIWYIVNLTIEFIQESKVIYDSLKYSFNRSIDDNSIKSNFEINKFLDLIENLRNQATYKYIILNTILISINLINKFVLTFKFST